MKIDVICKYCSVDPTNSENSKITFLLDKIMIKLCI